ncbi:adhesin, partial [Salmonella enterica subsp. enterica]|nr:adhesin [Salmonella enterica subsp. enterica]ECJ4522132.1 adhesin [Salmonella enterica subsp. enterica]
MKKLAALSVFLMGTFCHSSYAGFNTPTAYGDGATAGTAGTAIGNESTAVAGGTALGSLSYAGANNTIAIGGHGGGGGAYAEDSIAIGTLSKTTGKYAIAEGVWAQASGAGSIAMGSYANASGDNSVALGNNSTASRENTVSVGNDTLQRQITNVAAGTENTDAVNVQQLNENISYATDEMKNYTDASSRQTLIDANTYTDNSVSNAT